MKTNPRQFYDGVGEIVILCKIKCINKSMYLIIHK